MRNRYKFVYTGNPHFVTSSVVKWIKIFHDEECVKILTDAIKYHQMSNGLELFAYVIMKDHFHLVCRSEKLTNIMLSIKSYTAKKIIKKLEDDKRFSILKQFEGSKINYKKDRRYQVWQEGFHPQEIKDSFMLIQKINYIHYNPVKAKYVDDIFDWKYSSAGDLLLDKEGILKLSKYSC